MEQVEDLIRGWFAAGDEGDVEAFDRYLHPDVVIHAPMGLSTTGIEEEREVWRRAKHAMPDIRHAIVETLCAGNVVAARSLVTGTLRGEFAGVAADGTAFEFPHAVFAHVRDGRIIEAWEIADTGELLRQIGSSAP